MKRSFHTLLHLAFWLAYLVVAAAVMFAALQGTEILPEDRMYYFSFVFGAGIIPPFYSFYTHYLFLFPRYLQQRKLGLSLLAGMGSLGLGFLLPTLSPSTEG